jgi:hypothetical protein
VGPVACGEGKLFALSHPGSFHTIVECQAEYMGFVFIITEFLSPVMGLSLIPFVRKLRLKKVVIHLRLPSNEVGHRI